MEVQKNEDSTTTPSEVQATVTRSDRTLSMSARYQDLRAKAEHTE